MESQIQLLENQIKEEEDKIMQRTHNASNYLEQYYFHLPKPKNKNL